MQSNLSMLNFNILKNKYFFVLCFYLKKKKINNNYILDYLFVGYKYNYLLLNIYVFIKFLKNILNLIKSVTKNNGNILVLNTQNNLINYILQKNCFKYNINYLNNFTQKQTNLFNYLNQFPDLIISFDYKNNAIFLNKIFKYNIPIICVTNTLNKFLVQNQIYYLILNNNSIYANLLIIYLFFNNIYINRKI